MLLISGDHIFGFKSIELPDASVTSKRSGTLLLSSYMLFTLFGSLYPVFLYHIWPLYNARCASFSIELAQIF